MYASASVFLFYIINKECSRGICERPSKFLAIELASPQFAEYNIIILWIYQYLTIAEKQEFLTADVPVLMW